MLVYDIQHLTKIYPGQTRPANDDISLQIYASEIFGLLGDNGAGKSTLATTLKARPMEGHETKARHRRPARRYS
jgi:ABC-type uncharacterized transport system ATPase subunit